MLTLISFGLLVIMFINDCLDGPRGLFKFDLASIIRRIL
jgi:hypothetical protein